MFTQIQNVFFSFYLVSPPSDEALSNSINVKTPLLKVDTLSRLEDYPPPVSVSFGIANYCKDFFEPITDDINQSYHQLTDIKLIESYYVGSIEGSIGEYQKHIYYCHGNIHATFIINGDPELVTATYKLTADIYEKL
ncbi:MAG TPA: hypothetical protein VFI14_02285 [Chryseosolibacter sp.]|nr:hypothetical protein [Chryseosolibacter sp.]